MPKLELITDNMHDDYVRENFEKIMEHLNNEVIMGKFDGKHFEFEFTAASTNYKIAHGLASVPKDAWLTYVSPDSGVTVTFNYDEFDETYIDITVSAACTVRFFAGSWREEE